MSGPGDTPGGAPGDLVRRLDPGLFLTALFAPEPGRGRLLLVYAVDLELARSVQPARKADAGPLIAQMRLQWWRDLLEAAEAGAEPRAHEVAGPLGAAVAEGRLPAAPIRAMIEGYAREIDPELAPENFRPWAEQRFGGRLAAGLAALGAAAPDALVAEAGAALGAAFALKTAAPMAAEGRTLLPGLPPAGRAGLAEGRLEPEVARLAAGVAKEGREALARARAAARGLARPARPALLPLWEGGRILARAARQPEALLGGDLAPGPARRAAGLAYAALTGRI